MDLPGIIKNVFSGFTSNSSSAKGVSGNDFLRYGNRRMGGEDWSKVEMSDIEFYTGYFYAAINNRANKVAQLAEETLKTKASDSIVEAAKKKKEDIVHPYITLIDESDDFTNYQFWYDISTYLDLEGVYYLMAVRNVAPNLVGEIQYFKMLNPYDIRVVRSADSLEVGGYVETRDGLVREISKDLIIPIRKLNPFSRDRNFAMTDAAKDAQFTMKQAGDFTRSSLKNNLSAPGIITTDILMDRENFANFQARVTSQEKGMPLFGNGAGSINYESMQVDMDKAALSEINSINRDQLFAVSGVSKTTMGLEESGTTRETSKTQKDKFIEDHIMPQLQLILDALNQDYKKNYKSKYKTTKYVLSLENPLGSDKDAEIKEIEVADSSYKLYDSLVADGYDREIAAKYANGEITLEELGEPTNEPRPNPIIEAAMLKSGETPQNPNVSSPSGGKTSSDTKVDDTAASKKQEDQKDVPADSKKTKKAVNQISARDIPNLYEGTGINIDDLGCIMLDVQPFDVLKYVPQRFHKDLLESTDRHNHKMGAVAESEAHVTLLYGLLENGNKWKDKVDSVLEGWDIDSVEIEEVGYFEKPDSYAIVGHVKKTDELIDANERISLLPHVNTFSEYKPHVTLAYVNKNASVYNWVTFLSEKYNGKKIKAMGINYGRKEKIDNELSEKEINGGKGSGNFGHEGRPGKVGGSSDTGSAYELEKKYLAKSYDQSNVKRKKDRSYFATGGKSNTLNDPLDQSDFSSTSDFVHSMAVNGSDSDKANVLLYSGIQSQYKKINGYLRNNEQSSDINLSTIIETDKTYVALRPTLGENKEYSTENYGSDFEKIAYKKDTIGNVVKSMDNLTSKNSLPMDIKLSRMAQIPYEIFENMKKGTSFSDKGFVSTSLFQGKNNLLTKRVRDHQSVYMTIKAKKGQKGFFVNKEVDTSYMYTGENEFVLPRDSKFRVSSVSKPKYGKVYMELEII